jgi:uncharacterized membrane protein YeaQ/YmgE (transglycosylase-associated protein family)
MAAGDGVGALHGCRVTHKERPRLGFIHGLIIIGLIAGFLARLLVPGRDSLSIGATILLGIVGSFIGGFLGWALFGKDLDEGALQPSGIIGSILGAVIVLLIYNATSRRQHHLGMRH